MHSIRLMTLAGSLLLSGFASAQDAQKLQRVEITGSHLLSYNVESPAPIQVLTSADIAASGAVNLQELITLGKFPAPWGGILGG